MPGLLAERSSLAVEGGELEGGEAVGEGMCGVGPVLRAGTVGRWGCGAESWK